MPAAAATAGAGTGAAQPRLRAHSPQRWVFAICYLSTLAAPPTPQAPAPTGRTLLQGTGHSTGEMPKKYT